MDNTNFMEVCKGNLKVFISKDRYDDKLVEILSKPLESIITENKKHIIKWTDDTIVLKIASAKGNLFYKGIFTRRFTHKVKSIYRQPIGERVLRASLELSKKGFLTASLIAYGYLRKFKIVKYSFVVTSELEKALPLSIYIQQAFMFPPIKDKLFAKRDFIRILAKEIKRMHQNHIFHSDLRGNNIMIRNNSGKIEIYFIDHDKSIGNLGSKDEQKEKLRNLFQLNKFPSTDITNTDRMRFFKSYVAKVETEALSRRDRLGEAEKQVARKVIRRTRKWALKKYYASPIPDQEM
jgi:tRNA A-37 threonylcarbamoyl transferase component Bud32